MVEEIKLHKGQSEVFRYLFDPVNPKNTEEWQMRNAVVVGSRGWGKSYFAATAAMTAVGELMAMPSDVPNKSVTLIAPTHGQTQSIYTPLFNDLFQLDRLAVKYNSVYGRYWMPNNVLLQLFSYEAAQRLRGTGQYLVILDEMSTWDNNQEKVKEALESVILPTVTTRWSPERATDLGAPSPGRTLTISSPLGYDTLYDLYNRQDSDPSWKSWKFDYKQSPYLSKREIEKVKLTMDPQKFAREYGASFEESGNSVFYAFDRRSHVIDVDPIREDEQLHVAMDFNVGINASVVMVERGGVVYVVDEFSGAYNTEETCRNIWKKYGKTNPIAVYPDPSGKQRKTSATTGTTDFTIIENSRNEYEWRMKLYAKGKAPGIVDSVSNTNRMLLDADGNIRFFVHKSCPNTINSLERTKWVENNPNSAMIDKKGGVEHWTDGIRYYIDYRFPGHTSIKKPVMGYTF